MAGLLGKLSPKTSTEEFSLAKRRQKSGAQSQTGVIKNPALQGASAAIPQGNATVVMNRQSTGPVPAPDSPEGKASTARLLSALKQEVPRWARVLPSAQKRMVEILQEAKELFIAEQLQRTERDPQDSGTITPEIAQKLFQDLREQKLQQDACAVSAEEFELAASIFAGMVSGQGPLRPLLEDKMVSEVFIDGPEKIRCLRGGEYQGTPLAFLDMQDYQVYIERLVAAAQLEVAPVTRASNEGEIAFSINDHWRTRVHLRRPASGNLAQATLTLHLTRLEKPTLHDLVSLGMLPSGIAAFLSEFFSAPIGNLLIVGPRGVGKSTLLEVLLASVVERERVAVVETSGEFGLIFPSAQSLPIPQESQDLGEVLAHLSVQRVAIADAPERAGALHVQAVESGLAGTSTCIHAASASSALWKISDGLSRVSGAKGEQLLSRVSSAVSLVVVIDRVFGRPVIKELVEVLPSDGVEFSLRPLVRIEPSPDGNGQWKLLSSQSLLVKKLRERGIVLSETNGVVVPSANSSAQIERPAMQKKPPIV